MSAPSGKKWILTFVKIAIAVTGLWYVVHISKWNDEATLKAQAEVATNQGVLRFMEPTTVEVLDEPPAPSGKVRVRFSTKPAKVEVDGKFREVAINGDNVGLLRECDLPASLFVQIDARTDNDPPGPKLTVGLKHLLHNARRRWWLLAAAWSLLLFPFVITSWRWMKLLQAQDIRIPYKKCFELTFVGQFYSTFLPGTTSGDVVKIVYASRLTGAKTKSAITVLLDRVIGLIALMVIGATAAAFQMRGDPMMQKVFLLVLAGLSALTLGSVVYFSHRLRGMLGLNKLLEHPKVPEFLRKADDVLRVYKHHKWILVQTFAVSLLAQFLAPLMAWLCGMAFGVSGPNHAHLGHYMAYVPVALLAAAMPVAPPQGFGVMDYLLYLFLCQKPLEASGHVLASAGQTIAITQAIRFLPVIWNLVGAYWVVRGNYSQHKNPTSEQAQEALQAVGLNVNQAPPG